METFHSSPDILTGIWFRYDTEGWSNSHGFLLGEVQLQLLLFEDREHFVGKPN